MVGCEANAYTSFVLYLKVSNCFFVNHALNIIIINTVYYVVLTIKYNTGDSFQLSSTERSISLTGHM